MMEIELSASDQGNAMTQTSAASIAVPAVGFLLRFAVGALVSLPAFGQVTTNVSFDASATALTQTERDQITSHLSEAMRRWSALLAIDGARSIEVEVSISSAPTASSASAYGIPIGEAGGRSLLEQGVAYELRTGIDANGTDPDMYLDIGLNYLRNSLWFDPDPASRTAPVPSNGTDAMSMLLHEAGHAIAYNGWSDPVTGVPPADMWSTFDRWMVPGAPTVFSGPNAVAAWGSAPDLTTGNNKHWGNQAAAVLPPVVWQAARPIEWHNGFAVPPRVPAPPTLPLPEQPNAVQASLIDQLMNGIVFYGGHRYDISPLDIAVLKDVGLPLDRLFANGFD